MPKLPRIPAREAITALERMGFVQVCQSGSHILMRKITPEGDCGCVVPLHRELAAGTLRGILRQAGVSPEDFIRNL
jgi:predicted RNA binding protein YcfA (HicA-like mRNA interferase family)